MKIVVLKFGGTSVGSIQKIKKVAEIIREYKKKKYKIIVVSSAMSGVTNSLVKKSRELSENFSDAEYDTLVSSGEQVACSLIAGRLIHIGLKSRSWLAWQIPIISTGLYKNSRIKQINKNKILKYIKSGGIPIITGFQAINSEERINTTTNSTPAYLKTNKLTMQNDQGQIMDLYIPRKCSWTNKILASNDYGSVQFNVGHVDPKTGITKKC